MEASLTNHLQGKRQKFKDHYRWIISSILFRHFVDKRMDRDSFTRLSIDGLRMVISKRKTSEFIADLIKWGIIQSNGFHDSRTHTATGYRLSDTYRGEKPMAIQLTNRKMIDKLTRLEQTRRDVTAKLKGYREVQRWLHELDIDTNAALDHIATITDDHAQHIRHQQVEHIALKQFFGIVDPTAGRYHHNLSNLSSDLRPFLSINGHQLGQVDITNSQPLFFALSLQDSPRIPQEEKDMMTRLVTTGTFYEHFGANPEGRKKFKKEFFRDVLFSVDVKDIHTSPTIAQFKADFPGYFQVILDMRRKQTNALPIAMQKAEAKLIFTAVERFAMATRYQVPILTIHDSLVTSADHLALARHILEQTFRDVYGVTPSVSTK